MPLEKVNDQDMTSIYKELAAATPIRPKIGTDYLENLRVKFLDTRQQQLRGAAQQAFPGEQQEAPIGMVTQEEKNLQNLTIADFETLVYMNALAKRPEEAEKAIELMKKQDLVPNVKIMNHLLDAYANVNDLASCISSFKKIQDMGLEPDVYSYSGLIKAFVKSQQLEPALVIFNKMKKNNIIPSQPIFSNLISGCLKTNDIKMAWELFDSMRLSYHQPDEVAFTLMLHACAMRGEVERALNLFEDMTGHDLYPTDVTFNVLINACAKRSDYYEEAFSLLEQMQEHYGFQPDRITYNTLLKACARKKDLRQARHIFKSMWLDAQQKGDASLVKPDSITYTNLFWCYASYQPIHGKNSSNKNNKSNALIEYSVLPDDIPNRRSAVVKEAKWLFDQMVDQKIEMSTSLLTSYMTMHVTQKSYARAVEVYLHDFDRFNIPKDAYTFEHILECCYKTKDLKLTWKVWEAYKDFIESRRGIEPTGSVLERKAAIAEKEALRLKEGWTDEQQHNLVVMMANTLAVSGDIKNAISILSSELRNSKLRGPRLKELGPLYNKCIQLEEEEARKELVSLCAREQKRPMQSKFARVN
ncbi:TPR-like protein [Backusella circina FSU 941]|nr:TPR-like protein [Backusella circina FSU 941]